MTVKVNMHDVTKVEARSFKDTEWLRIDNNVGSHILIFMPLYIAEAMQAAWEDSQKPVEGIEPEFDQFGNRIEGPDTLDEAFG